MDSKDTTVHEIARDTYRISTCIPDIGPDGFTINQYLVVGEDPFLFHTGLRGMFGQVAEAVGRVVDVGRLRWIGFGHVEADECGAMNRWLEAAPASEITFNPLGCQVSLDDLADRPPRPLDDGETLDIGGHVLRAIVTPHVPHGWEAQVLYDESTGALLCGDLFSQLGDGPALVHDGDLVGAALAADELFGATALTPHTAPTLRRLAGLAPRTLALMHGPAFAGDGAAALHSLADAYEQRLAASAAVTA